MIIAVDFDGVLCEKKWPDIGGANIKLIERLKELKSEGHTIILWTCRTDDDFKDYKTQETRHLLTEAVEWCREHGLEFNCVNEPDTASRSFFGGNPRKIYANVYIDDQNASEEFCRKYGIPFIYSQNYLKEIL